MSLIPTVPDNTTSSSGTGRVKSNSKTVNVLLRATQGYSHRGWGSTLTSPSTTTVRLASCRCRGQTAPTPSGHTFTYHHPTCRGSYNSPCIIKGRQVKALDDSNREFDLVKVLEVNWREEMHTGFREVGLLSCTVVSPQPVEPSDSTHGSQTHTTHTHMHTHSTYRHAWCIHTCTHAGPAMQHMCISSEGYISAIQD